MDVSEKQANEDKAGFMLMIRLMETDLVFVFGRNQSFYKLLNSMRLLASLDCLD